MAEKFNGFEGGANGTTITTANSAETGDAFNPAHTAAGGTIQYSTAQAAHGNVSARIVAQTGQGPLLRHTLPPTPRLRMRGYFRLDAMPSGPVSICAIRTPGDASVSSLIMHPDGRLLFSGGGTDRAADSGTIQAATWYGLSYTVDLNGEGYVALFDMNGNTITTPYMETDRDYGSSSDLISAQVGHHVAGEPDIAIHWDSFGVSDQPGHYGPYSEAESPELDVSVLDPAYSIVDLSGSTAGGEGNLTFTFSPSAGVVDLGSSRFAVPRGETETTYTITATNQTSNLSDQTTITVAPLATGGDPADYTGYTQTVVYTGANWT